MVFKGKASSFVAGLFWSNCARCLGRVLMKWTDQRFGNTPTKKLMKESKSAADSRSKRMASKDICYVVMMELDAVGSRRRSTVSRSVAVRFNRLDISNLKLRKLSKYF